MLKLFKIWFLYCAFIAAPKVSWAAQLPFPKTGSSIGVTFLRRPELVRNIQGRTIPLDAKVISQNLARYDAVWLSQDIIEYNRSAWNLIRQTAPEKIMLRYNCSVSSRLKTRHILDYNYINTYHPEWFLLKDAKDPFGADPRNPDNRIRWDASNKNSSSYNRFYLDVGNEEFQDWAVQQILNYVSGKKGEFNYGSWKSKRLDYPYSGLAFDNVVLRRIKVRFNKPYPNWKYANNIQGWKDGFLRYLRKVYRALAEHRYILVINASFYWDLERNGSDLYDLMDTADGIMHEWAVGYGTRYWGGEKWQRCIERHEAVAKKGLIDWWACYPKEPDPGNEQFRYVYCSFLLVKRPGYSLFYASSDKGTGRTRQVPWYDEYNLQIGQPTSNRYLRDGCWFRNYTNAKIVVNPTEMPRKVLIDRNKLWLDWTSKKTVRELTLSPKSGRILLATSYRAGAPTTGLGK